MRWATVAALLLGSLASLGCSPAAATPIPPNLASPFTGYRSARYADPSAWLCYPGRAGDPCAGDLSTTELHADGSRPVVRAPVDVEARDVDCFYVYPTVDTGFFAKNHDDFTNLTPMRRVARFQAAHFTEACRVIAPLYRQITFGTYLAPVARRDAFLAVAFSDVEDAFLHYMANMNGGRRVVLIGHSQGAEMVARLLKKRFDDDPAMRARLVVALPIGGKIEVPRGQLTGGTFKNLPLCTAPDETACVVAYQTHRVGRIADTYETVTPGNEMACVNPADEADNRLRRFSRTIVALDDGLRKSLGAESVATPFLSYTGYYSGRCVDGLHGYRYLEVAETPAPHDARKRPFDLSSWIWGTGMGLHVLDMQLPQGDLVELVRRKARASRSPRPPL